MIIGARAHTAEQAGVLAKAGQPFVEISVLSAEALDRDRKALRQLQDRYGTRFLAHGPEEGNAWDPGFLSCEMVPRINEISDCLPELGIELLTIHFWLDARFIEPRIIDEKIALLRLMAEHAASRGVQLCVENLSERPADFDQALGSIESLGMTLDVGHGELLSQTNTAHDFLARAAEKIYHMHVHDNHGGSTPADDVHLLPGQGSIDFESIFASVARCGYNRTMTLEVAPEKAPQARDYIQQLWNAVVRRERISP